MKKWILALAVVALASFGATAQTVSLSYDDGNNGFKLLTEKPHEVKLNLITSTVMLHPEVAYDYTINTDLSVGGRVSFNIKNDNDQADETLGNFQISPYVRWHFYKNTSGNALRGFYVEGNMAYTNYTYVSNRILNVNDPEHIMTTEKSKANQFGLGVGAGYRWITKGAWSFELGAVVGRNLLNNDAPNVYWNTIFSIGKRF
ncbi:autotransporter outer membrane beta-barrel domain-containing protein [uncultured Porphyromonas sp.]|uniref:autotransporter outer membrane beta-barrel domain-containing protein n=1 Tax=uncultured Porphyromonas sp. TaxID=159274 RepID=UPI002588231B|nr:autotransporter outer membrane beta-barrel domain-containing protein [uncultured Porphyromonas sp.]